jgi:hypothetical protein
MDNVVAARAPDRLAEIHDVTGLSTAEVKRGLELWSRLLRDVAPDFLGGDHTVFEEAKDVIRERVHEHPQRVEVWLPDTVSPEEAFRAIEQQRSQVPPEVEVVERRYLRPRRLIGRAKDFFGRRR